MIFTLPEITNATMLEEPGTTVSEDEAEENTTSPLNGSQNTIRQRQAQMDSEDIYYELGTIYFSNVTLSGIAFSNLRMKLTQQCVGVVAQIDGEVQNNTGSTLYCSSAYDNFRLYLMDSEGYSSGDTLTTSFWTENETLAPGESASLISLSLTCDDYFKYYKNVAGLEVGIKGIDGETFTPVSRRDFKPKSGSSGFNIYRDSNSFSNTSNTSDPLAGFAHSQTYQLSDYYYNELVKDKNLIYRNILKKDMNSRWTGACYGIALSMGLLKEEYITTGDLCDQSGVYVYNDLPKPSSNRKLLNNLNYYHLVQNLYGANRETTGVSYNSKNGTNRIFNSLLYNSESLSSVLKKLCDNTMSDKALVIRFTTPEISHAILAIGGYYDSTNDVYKILLYDENTVGNSDTTGDFSFMTISSDYREFSFTTNTNKSINQRNYQRLEINTIENLSHYALTNTPIHSTNQLMEDNADNSISANHIVLACTTEGTYRIENSQGEYITYDGEDFIGTLKVYDINIGINNNVATWYFETDKSNSFKLSNTSKPTELQVFDGESCFMSISANSIDTIVVTPNESELQLSGSNYDFTAFMSTDLVNNEEYGLVSISANATSNVKLSEVSGNAVNLKADSTLHDIQTAVYIGTNVSANNVSEGANDVTVKAEDGSVICTDNYTVQFDSNGGNAMPP